MSSSWMMLFWKNVAMNARRMYFWKDDKRRFIGVSRSFLQYFGLDSEKAVIGKTDEDLRWHINPDPLIKDEEEILRSGKKIYQKRGECIVNGVNRDVITSKIPVYRDGRITGILGAMVDAEETQKFLDEEKKTSSADPITGLANARGISDGVYAYLIERWGTGMNFAMVEVYVPEYSEVVKLYGDHSGDCLLQEIGVILRNCGGTGCVTGRVHGSCFYLLMKYDSKAEVRNVARRIRAGIESVRKAGQWSGNCSAVIRVAYTDSSSRDRSAYTHGLTGVILNSRDNEEL